MMVAPRVHRPLVWLVTILVLIFSVSSESTHVNLDPDVLAIYSKHNLTYSCLPYLRKDTIAECDCLACTNDVPNFKHRMCKFFEEVRTKGKADLLNRNLVNVCTSIQVCSEIPDTCCDPSDPSPKHNRGCPVCIPTVKSEPGKKGVNANCLLAEYEAAQPSPPRGPNWKATYQAFYKAMREVRLSPKCSTYALYKTAKLCDCEDCLQNENELRDKLCRLGEKIRADEKLGRKGYLRTTEYFKKFCDKNECPSMPNKCCAQPSARDNQNPVDRRGCPTCIPTSASFGFGPRCRRDILALPQPVKLQVYELP